MAGESQASQSSFYIEEVEGPDQDRQTLTLMARMMPYRPYTLEGKQRAEVTFYQGNAVGSFQIMGATEEPTVIHGMWKQRFLYVTDQPAPDIPSFLNPSSLVPKPPLTYQQLNPSPSALDTKGQAIKSVRDLVDQVEGFRRRGKLLAVTWMDRSRTGILTRFKQSWDTFNDVQWEMEFTWSAINREDRVGAFKLETAPDLSKANALLSTLIGGIQALQTVFGAIEALNASVAQLQNVIIDATNTVNNVLDGVGSAVNAVTRLAGTWGTIVDSAQEVEDNAISIGQQLLQIPSSGPNWQQVVVALNPAFAQQGVAQALSPPSVGVQVPGSVSQNAALGSSNQNPAYRYAIQSITNRLTIGTKVRAIVKACRDLKYYAAEQEDQLRKQKQDNNIIAAVVARDGQDLRGLSTQFYGTPDGWKTIARFNQLQTSKLQMRQVVLIPRQGNVSP